MAKRDADINDLWGILLRLNYFCDNPATPVQAIGAITIQQIDHLSQEFNIPTAEELISAISPTRLGDLGRCTDCFGCLYFNGFAWEHTQKGSCLPIKNQKESINERP